MWRKERSLDPGNVSALVLHCIIGARREPQGRSSETSRPRANSLIRHQAPTRHRKTQPWSPLYCPMWGLLFDADVVDALDSSATDFLVLDSGALGHDGGVFYPGYLFKTLFKNLLFRGTSFYHSLSGEARGGCVGWRRPSDLWLAGEGRRCGSWLLRVTRPCDRSGLSGGPQSPPSSGPYTYRNSLSTENDSSCHLPPLKIMNPKGPATCKPRENWHL